MTDKPTRPIEMGIAFQGGQWTTEVVDIPADTSEDMILSVAILAVPVYIDAVGFWVYNSMDDDCPETEIPRRLQKWVILFFDADQTTEGTDIDQGRAAVAQVNDVLSSQPYGLGACLTELPNAPIAQ